MQAPRGPGGLASALGRKRMFHFLVRGRVASPSRASCANRESLSPRARMPSLGKPYRIGLFAARGATAFFVAFAAFQIALAAGAPFGKMTWGGSTAVLPTGLRAASAGAAFYLVLAAAAMLVRSGDLGRGLPQAPFRWFNGLLALQLGLNTVANLASHTAAERYGMGAASALGFVLCVCALVAAPKQVPGPRGPASQGE